MNRRGGVRMILGLQNLDWAYIGAKLANEDDKEQTTFFKSFVKECLSWGTSYQVGLQLAGVSQELTEKEKDVLSQISYKEGEHE